jgi:AAA+ superfamily predicted ATPase
MTNDPMKGANQNDDVSVLLSPAYSMLNQLLTISVDRQAQRLGPATLLDPWRGMHLGADDIKVILREMPHIALGGETEVTRLIGSLARKTLKFARIADWLGLSDRDLTIIVLALAPDVDLRYERIYGYLQDDITRKRPSIDLIANLLCANIDERIALFESFGPQSPLVKNGVLEWNSTEISLIARPLVLDELWRNYIFGREELDPKLARFARLLSPGGVGIDSALVEPGVAEIVKAAALEAVSGTGRVRLLLIGPHGAGKTALAAGLAHDLDMKFLVLDMRDIATPLEIRETLNRARVASAMLGALLYIHGVGALMQRDPQLLRAMSETLAATSSWFVLSLNSPLQQMHTQSLRAMHLPMSLPSAEMRMAIWRSALVANEIGVEAEDVERIATRFRLSAAQIGQAVSDVCVTLPGDRPWRVSGSQLSVAARALCGNDLARLAQRIHPEATFDQLITTSEANVQLREICSRVAAREVVRRDWTRDCIHARNAGVTALFAGPSGTGKTLAAEVIAHELGYDLFRIDLSAIVSKYIGETEKNLDRVFAAAENANAVLFFDEADALFGKRSEVKDAHDRYANIEIAYLLQKMEQFDGLAILATNLKQNLDDAFARRLTFSVNFSFPEATERLRLWGALWPKRAPRADDIDLGWFAQEYQLSGGNIRNTVLAAVHLAAANGQVVSREHLLHATRREYQKLGKNIPHPEPVDQRCVS